MIIDGYVASIIEQNQLKKISDDISGKDVVDACKFYYARGYSKAENDYFKKTEKDRQDSYDCGYQQGVSSFALKVIQAYYDGTLDECEIHRIERLLLKEH